MDNGIEITIRNNYSIGEILEKYNAGIRSEEILYLKKIIDDYADAMNAKIRNIYMNIPDSSKETAMKWISANVDIELAPYIRMAYLGTYKPEDILKCNRSRYKSLKDIGITISETDSALKIENWIREWETEAKRVGEALGDSGRKIFESHAHYNLKNFSSVYPCLKCQPF